MNSRQTPSRIARDARPFHVLPLDLLVVACGLSKVALSDTGSVSNQRPLKGQRAMKITYDLIHRIVSRIPRGRVATYGQIAELAGIPGQARRVGYALSALPDGSPVPWQRVVNAKGEISLRTHPGAGSIQRKLLQTDGVRFDRNGRISLDRFQWRPSA